MTDTIHISRPDGPRVELDLTSLLDLRRVMAGGVDWSPGLEIVDDGDPRIWHSLQGFLFTCGPDHIRHPDDIEGTDGRYPIHGSAAGHPAELTGQGADWARARIPLRLVAGGEALIEREWRIEDDGWVCLRDRVTNTGSLPFASMTMYHMNVGGRLLGPETRLEGAMFEGGGMAWTFFDDPGGVFCVPATRGADGEGMAHVALGPVAAADGLSLELRFNTAALPHLQMWRARRDGVNVMGIEPCTHRWESRQVLRDAGELDFLEKGHSRDFSLAFRFSRGATAGLR